MWEGCVYAGVIGCALLIRISGRERYPLYLRKRTLLHSMGDLWSAMFRMMKQAPE
jgi:hypothetical protein